MDKDQLAIERELSKSARVAKAVERQKIFSEDKYEQTSIVHKCGHEGFVNIRLGDVFLDDKKNKHENKLCKECRLLEDDRLAEEARQRKLAKKLSKMNGFQMEIKNVADMFAAIGDIENCLSEMRVKLRTRLNVVKGQMAKEYFITELKKRGL